VPRLNSVPHTFFAAIEFWPPRPADVLGML
jgi:hypothetical protein